MGIEVRDPEAQQLALQVLEGLFKTQSARHALACTLAKHNLSGMYMHVLSVAERSWPATEVVAGVGIILFDLFQGMQRMVGVVIDDHDLGRLRERAIIAIRGEGDYTPTHTWPCWLQKAA